MKCLHYGTNHSKDTSLVYYGRTEPITICGYHARYHLRETLRQARLRSKAK